MGSEHLLGTDVHHHYNIIIIIISDAFDQEQIIVGTPI